MNKNFERINNSNNSFENLENISKRIVLNKDIINKLYNLFIISENPNNPRNRYVLEEKDFYTIPYLANRLNLTEKETLNIFRQMPFCRIMLHKNEIPIVYFDNFNNFKKIILMKYNYFIKIEKIKNKEFLKENNSLKTNIDIILEKIEKQNSELIEKLKNLNQNELEYLKLVIFNNPSGVFNVNKSGIIRNKLNKNLQIIHLNKNSFFNKCIALGLMERIGGPKLKIKEDLLAYFK